jgi:DnaJ-class molecular chaperone
LTKYKYHPDRRRDDPDATAKFNEVSALLDDTVKDEESRRAYDSMQDEDEIEALSNRVRSVTMN